VSGSCWKNCACTWRGAGSPGWDSSKSFLITRRSPRTGMAAFRSRICFRTCLSTSWNSASLRVWSRVRRCRSMAASSWRTRAITVVSARTVGGGSAGELGRAEVPGRTGAGERRWRTHPSARQGVDHRPGFNLPDQGEPGGRTGLLRQLSNRQQKLCDRGGASHGGTFKSGERGSPRDD